MSSFAVDVAVNAVETTEGTKKSDPVIEICYHLPRAARAHRYPFTEPAVRPLAMYRCATTSKIAAGTIANTPAAITAPQSVE